jgi:hypothetical protein
MFISSQMNNLRFHNRDHTQSYSLLLPIPIFSRLNYHTTGTHGEFEERRTGRRKKASDVITNKVKYMSTEQASNCV